MPHELDKLFGENLLRGIGGQALSTKVFGNKSSKHQNMMGSHFYGRASLATQQNRPISSS
jgi:hypothetical protein